MSDELNEAELEFYEKLGRLANGLTLRGGDVWEWTTFTRPNGESIETVEHVIEAQTYSAMQSDKAVLHGVVLGDDSGLVVAYTGNGVKSSDHALYIAATKPSHIILMLNRIADQQDELRAARARIAALEAALGEAKRECIMTPFCAAAIAQEKSK